MLFVPPSFKWKELPPAMESKCLKLEEYEYQINIWIDFDFFHFLASSLTHVARTLRKYVIK